MEKQDCARYIRGLVKVAKDVADNGCANSDVLYRAARDETIPELEAIRMEGIEQVCGINIAHLHHCVIDAVLDYEERYSIRPTMRRSTQFRLIRQQTIKPPKPDQVGAPEGER